MKNSIRLISILTCLCIAVMGFSLISAAEDTVGYSYIQKGNGGAVITFDDAVSSAITEDTDLVSVSVSGKTVTVTGVTGAVGVATVKVFCGTVSTVIEVPVGYTTFIFEGDTLTVYEGSDSKYEISGINASDEEYLEGDLSLPLEVAENPDGSKSYKNSNDYSLSVNIKKKGGTYVFSGHSDDMSIAVKKEASAPATLLLCSLDLTSSFTAPIVVKRDSLSTVTITALRGHENTLTDSEKNNGDIYGPITEGGDGSNFEYAESAVIKGKSYSNITLNGGGTLNLVCNTKNAIKSGEYGSLKLSELTLNIESVRNGISADNNMEFTSGTYNIEAEQDGVRTDPDLLGTDIGCAGNIVISGGELDITAGGDGIQSAQDITVTGGKVNIKASGKGLKASYNTDDTSDTSEATNTVDVSGGIVNIDTTDDAIHADAYVDITGGELTITTGDDAIHADTVLTLGEQGGADCAISLKVLSSYEALEAGTVYMYSGVYDVTASDDGINAAGGAGGDAGGFNPFPGNRPGRPGGNTGGNTATGSFSLNIAGGVLTLNAGGDGLDSNGPLNITGGNINVWSSGNADEPLDCDGTLMIKDATVFAAGAGGRMTHTPGSGSQKYVSSTLSVTAGKTVNVNHNGDKVYNVIAPRKAGFVLYSASDMTSGSGYTFTLDSSELMDGDVISHLWDEGEVVKEPSSTEEGEKRYTCELCGATRNESIPYALDCYYATFTDCTAAWYHEAVDYVVDEGMMNGVGAGKFAPNGTLTRAMVVTVLYRAVGSPEVSAGPTFTDVKAGQWYTGAIAWAQANGVVNGVSPTEFAPDKPVTREQIAAILWRYSGSSAMDADLGIFTDGDTVSSYAKDAMLWAVSEGIYAGSNGALLPRDNATRAQFATIIMRFFEGGYPCADL